MASPLLTEESSSKTKSNTLCLCQECNTKPSLYCCPRCCFRSCSLACCVAHKKRLKCSGKRNRTAYQSLASMDDGTLQSDYHFLQDVLRETTLGKRLSTQLRLPKQSHYNSNKHNNKDDTDATSSLHPLLEQQETISTVQQQQDLQPQQLEDKQSNKRMKASHHNNNNNWLPPKWHRLVTQARRRNIHLKLMPTGMERHKQNTSIVKQDTIYWRVEFVLPNNTLIAPKVSEHANLWDELKKLVENDNNMDEWTLLLKKLPCPSNRNYYIELSWSSCTLQEALANTTVIEFPTIYIASTKAELECYYPRMIEQVE